MIPASLVLVAACSDYRVSTSDDAHGKSSWADDTGVPVETEIAALAEGTAHADIQRASWGDAPPSCLLEVAFRVPEDDPEPVFGRVAEVPDEPGSCALTRFDADETQAAAPLGARGMVDAGEVVQLADAAGAIALARREDANGVRYRRDDCRAEDWPGGRVFDLSASGSAREDGLPAFTLPDVVTVGPDVRRVLPSTAQLGGNVLVHPRATPLRLAWEETGPRPVLGDREVEPHVVVWLRHVERSENRPFEVLACIPDEDGAFEVPVETLAAFTPDPEDLAYMVAQVDLRWNMATYPAGWGTLRTGGMTSLSGFVELVEAE
jgi:hypothetical protein